MLLEQCWYAKSWKTETVILAYSTLTHFVCAIVVIQLLLLD